MDKHHIDILNEPGDMSIKNIPFFLLKKGMGRLNFPLRKRWKCFRNDSTKYIFFIGFCFLLTFRALAQFKVFSQHIPLPPTVNSPSDEFNLVLSLDGKQLYFTRKNHPENTGGTKDEGDIWISEKDQNGQWAMPRNLSSLNDGQSNQVVGFLDGGKSLLIYTPQGFALARRQKQGWSKPTPVPIPYFKSMSDALSASLSFDGRHLLLGMESYGSHGVEDIYVCHRKAGGTWTKPKNLGIAINSAHQEITPSIAPDNKTLFFSSNRPGGKGGFDLYTTTRLDDAWQQWSEPINLGEKINTEGWERFLTFLPGSEFAYLISTQNSKGYGDLKKVSIGFNITPQQTLDDTLDSIQPADEKTMIAWHGLVINPNTQEKIVSARVSLASEGQVSTEEVFSNSEGQFTLSLELGKSYTLKINALKHMPTTYVLPSDSLTQGGFQTYYLEPIVVGNTIVLRDILFEQSKAGFVRGSEKSLDLVIDMMRQNPSISIFLSGHTDNQGSSKLNLKLSQSRVDAVKDYLIARGIKPKRISGKGFGSTRPIVDNANPEKRELNRRVEFTIRE